MVKKFLRVIDINFEPIVGTIIFFAIIFLVTFDVILRIIFQAGLSWTEEFVRYMFVWGVFFCFSYVTRLNRHIRFSFLINNLPDNLSKFFLMLSDFIFFIFSCILFYFALCVVDKTFEFGDMTVTIRVSLNILYLTGVVGFILNIVRLIQNIVWKIRHMNSPIEVFSYYKSGENDVTVLGFLEPMGGTKKQEDTESKN